MGRIKASLADVSTEFIPVEPGLYELEIDKIEEAEKNAELVGYRVISLVKSAGEMFGRKISDYISIVKKNGEVNEVGLSTLKRYFEVTHGKEVVAEWSDDDYDTDVLKGKMFQAQVTIESYTPEGETEPRKNNKFKRMEAIG